MALIPLVVMVLVVLVVGVYITSLYNGLVMLKNNIEKAWSNIDVLLKQRHDELPKLVEVCKGYMAHESGALEKVMNARQGLISAQGPTAKGEAEGQLQGALRQLFALAESYPDLKAQASFAQLQTRISSLESEIADRREFYNESVNTYNIRIESIPDTFLAKFLTYTKKEMFKVDVHERNDVKIRF